MNAMSRAGFILTGGKSSRMGVDKALLPWRGSTLVEHIAETVRQANVSVSLVGPAERYRCLPYRVISDLRPHCGPLSGIEAALAATMADWNLILACDLNGVTAELVEQLFRSVESNTDARAAVAHDIEGRVQPLCGVYHRDCLTRVRQSLDRGEYRLLRLVEEIGPVYVSFTGRLTNLNTPEEWRIAQGS